MGVACAGTAINAHAAAIANTRIIPAPYRESDIVLRMDEIGIAVLICFMLVIAWAIYLRDKRSAS